MVTVISCPICGIQNSDDALLCSQCKAFLQAKVDTLDLFSTMWGMIESPKTTLKKVVLSRSKNYVFVLSVFAGLMSVFGYFWLYKIGNLLDGLLPILGLGVLLGPVAGLMFMSCAAGLASGLSAHLGGKKAYRNTFSVLSYAATPLLLAFVVFFPVEIAVFGQYLFGSNPHPMIIRPDLYIVLIVLNGIAVVWAFFLATAGIRTANALSFSRAAMVMLLSLGVIAGCMHIGTAAFL